MAKVLNIHPDIASGLIVHWTFDDGTGGDTSGASHQGILANAPTFVPGIVPALDGSSSGGALSFNGTNQLVSTTVPAIANNMKLAISAWIKINGNPASTAQIACIQDSVNGGVTSSNTVLWITTSGTVSWWTWSGGGVFTQTTSAGTVTNNQWRHVVGTYDGVTQDIYIDGKRDGTFSNAQSPTTDATPTFQINGTNAGGYAAHYWAGQMDDIRLYDRGLQPGEINALYNMRWQPWMENELPVITKLGAVPFVSVWMSR